MESKSAFVPDELVKWYPLESSVSDPPVTRFVLSVGPSRENATGPWRGGRTIYTQPTELRVSFVSFHSSEWRQALPICPTSVDPLA